MSRLPLLFMIILLLVLPARAQQLAPTLTEALLRVRVTDLNENPSEGEIITFISKQTDSVYEGVTNALGSFEILIPKGQTYIVNYRNFGYDHQYAEHEIPEYEGRLVSKINIKYRLPSKTVLEDVKFEDDLITLKNTSFESLDKLAELLKVKSNTVIRIEAHCDNSHAASKALEITQTQAKAIQGYLIDKGISAERLKIKGHGSRLPMASNESSAGRQKNNRIEIHIIK